MKTTEKPEVLFIWKVNDELRDFFQSSLSDIASPVFPETRDEADIFTLAKTARIIVGWAITEPLLAAARNLGLIVIPAIGVDRHIPILRKFPNVAAVNSRGNAFPTAQHAVALLLAVTNHLLHFDARMRQGLWRAFDDNPPSLFLEETDVGILGTGTVGQNIMRRLQPFGCRLKGCSRSGRLVPDFPDIPVVPVTHLHSFLASIRILIIAVPSTPETTGLIGRKEIDRLQKDAIIINVARGPVLDEQALYDALHDHRLMGAGIDVWYNYQPEPIDGKLFPWSQPFHELPNVVLSPHRGASPLRRPGRYTDVIDNIRRFIHGKPLTNRIDSETGY